VIPVPHILLAGAWRLAMLDTAHTIRSAAFGLGPAVVFPPGNFPFAAGAVTGWPTMAVH
jgi:hypothetical protein